MQTKLQKRLSRRAAPLEPENLKARCLSTIPVVGVARNVRFQKAPRSFKFQKVAATGVLMFSIGWLIALWNTRPNDNGAAPSSSRSVAFAETMEQFRHMPYGHVKGRDMEAGILRWGWHERDFFQTEMWFDPQRGFYRERRPGSSNTQPRLARETSSSALFLPNGISYYRYAGSSKVLVTSSDSHWQSNKKSFTNLLAGLWGNRSHSSSVGQWKGKQSQLFQSEETTSRSDRTAMPGVTRTQTRLYADPKTKLPLGFQEFAVYGDGVPRLLAEYEFDFAQPSARRFDPARITAGATMQHGRES